MTPQLTAPLTCVLPSQQDGPLRTQRERETGQRLGVVFLFLRLLLKTAQCNIQHFFSCFQPLAKGAMTRVKDSYGPPSWHCSRLLPRVAHTLPPTPSMTSSLFQRLGWGSLWFHPQARNVLVSSKAEVPLHCQKHKQAQLPETELLVPGDTVNTQGKGP